MEWFPMCDFLSKVTFVWFLFVQFFISLKCLKLNENDEKKTISTRKSRHKTNMEKRVRKKPYNAFRMVKQLVLLDCTRFI